MDPSPDGSNRMEYHWGFSEIEYCVGDDLSSHIFQRGKGRCETDLLVILPSPRALHVGYPGLGNAKGH